MNYFVKNIKINKLFHLKDLKILISENNPHLLITGKNGSGKTILLKAIADYLDTLEKNIPNEGMVVWEPFVSYSGSFEKFRGTVDLDIINKSEIIKDIENRNFIISYYSAGRHSKMAEPKTPTKPDLQNNSKSYVDLTDQFLYFLSDLKIQEALARNEQQNKDADEIRTWFDEFENMLKELYKDTNLKLIFNYKDYSFKISTNGKEFKFTEMSDGYIAAIDIIADLILKMQNGNSLTRNYKKEGIVLIDEIETHLHLELQRIVMPMLTKIFPNIQFIVSTHSPFVLSSMPNAVAYDLEHREAIDDLTEYSYEALAEGYFGVRTDSSYMEMRLESLRSLLEKDNLTNGDKEKISMLLNDFEQIPEIVSPLLKGEFLQLKVEYSDKLHSFVNMP